MKKALLSLAVIAASGAYVVYENHTAQPPTSDNAALAAVLPPSVGSPAPAPASHRASIKDATASPPATAATAAATSGVFVVTMPQAAAPAPTPVAAAAPAPAAIDIADAGSAPAADIAPPDNAVVLAPASLPLPRPRPADAPVAIESAAAQTTAQAQTGYRNGTFKGLSANAYYGRVQVDAVIQGGQLVKVDVLNYPSDRNRSRRINSEALPELQQEAIQAQSANIDAVSGATLSSQAFIQSLDSALQKAHGGGGNA